MTKTDYKTIKVDLRQCGDCAALPGYPHSKGCDVARCPACGIQQLQCDKHWRNKTPAMWTGIWPGEIECIEYDLWSKFVYTDTGELVDFSDPNYWNWRNEGRPVAWVKTTRDDPDASPDLNSLHSAGVVWHVKYQRFVKYEDFKDDKDIRL